MAEPEWDQQTRDMALALDDVDLCSCCGRPTAICQDPARQFDWKALDPVRCHATTAALARQKGMTEETNPHMAALQFPVMLQQGGSHNG